jgi:hypothetical protein
MPTPTPNHSFNKPVVGGDKDAWGGYINGNIDYLDAYLGPVGDKWVPNTGGQFTGLLGLSRGADVPSATALALGDDGNTFVVTGTTTIATIDTKFIGAQVLLLFADSLTLTDGVNLLLPGGADIVTQANDAALFVEIAAGAWQCVSYLRSWGVPIAGLINDPDPKLAATLDTNNQLVRLYAGKGLADVNDALLLAAPVAVPGAVNYLVPFNAADGDAVGHAAEGASANVNINDIPKGTGRRQVSSKNMLDVGHSDTMEFGMSSTLHDLGTGAGIVTLSEADGPPLKEIANTGAFQVDPPANNTVVVFDIINGVGAGAVTFPNFTKVDGEVGTGDGEVYRVQCSTINSRSLAQITEMF